MLATDFNRALVHKLSIRGKLANYYRGSSKVSLGSVYAEFKRNKVHIYVGGQTTELFSMYINFADTGDSLSSGSQKVAKIMINLLDQHLAFATGKLKKITKPITY